MSSRFPSGDEAGFEILDDEECLALLRLAHLGRVAVTMGALPAIFPVNYFVLDGRVVFRTGQGMKLRAALQNTVVAFEVDNADEPSETGWSVLAVGRAEEVQDPRVVDHVMRQPVHPWAPGDRSHVIAIYPEFLSGRRIRKTSHR
ncbi:MAG TPA: pyridoxamine 5'-phosphate oxidase family protein [Acidimicrobiales bacterium]|nr:pyridoxamine 5'-phosphate oxidase family protein [Acidimicrobiales bacterium]